MQPFEYFVRCHRAYIVNINHIIHISGNAQGYRLNLTENNRRDSCIPYLPEESEKAERYYKLAVKTLFFYPKNMG